MTKKIRNIGIIAHVDHGKTTLVDKLLQRAGTFREHEALQDRAMDSMDLEKEKGITIKSKNASIQWNDHTINIVDTPGHADFGGEVERILKMVDGVLLLVDAVEGPQAQTRFVLRKAIEQQLHLMVVINKIDRAFANPDQVHDQVLELLLELGASEEQFQAPFVYVSAKEGHACKALDDPPSDIGLLLDGVLVHIPAPAVDPEGPFQMLISNLDWSDYVGRIAIGKITSGSVGTGDTIVCVHKDGRGQRAKVSKLYTFQGLDTVEASVREAGDIVGIAGFDEVHIGETLCDSEEREPIPFVEIDPPTIQMQFCVNDGPLAGRDGGLLTARQIRERLVRETRSNISLEFADTEAGNVFSVSARGELQIAVLVETMRREGYEVLVSRPEVIYREVDGHRQEPFEIFWLESPYVCLGDLLQNLAGRKADVTDMAHVGDRVKLEGVIPTRGLIGLESYLANLSRGEAILSHMFKTYAPLTGEIKSRITGTLVATEKGVSTAYALDTIQERGTLFIGPQEEVYEGMVVGENSRPGDLPVNPTRTKQLTNVRASGSDKAILLEPPLQLSLEKAIEFIAPDEFVEATPNHLRLRKKILNATLRKRSKTA